MPGILNHPEVRSYTETLREQLEAANRELRRRDVADTLAKIDKLAADQAVADAAHKAAADKAAAVELEGHRRASWLNHRTTVALAAGGGAFETLLRMPDMLAGIPDGDWPPDDCAANYRVTGVPVPEPNEPVDDGIGDTLLGKALAAKGVRI